MSFAHPEALSWLFALAGIPLLYLIRRRARRRLVPHLFLWERVMLREGRDRRRRLRDLISILLQMALGACLILAWAGPFRLERVTVPGRVVVLIDVSASMGARSDRAEDRLAEARLAVIEHLDRLLAVGSVGVVTVADEITPRLPATFDREAVLAALTGLPTPMGRLDVDRLAGFLEDLRRGGERIHCVLYTDGAFATGDEGEGLADVSIVRVDRDRANAGWIEVALKEGEQDERMRLVATLGARGGALSGRCEVRGANGSLGETSVAVPAGGEQTVTLEVDAMRDAWLELVFLPDASDGLAADDRVELYSPELPRARVLVVAESVDPHLKAALGALDDFVDRRSAVALPSDWRRAEGYDLVILDRVQESRALPAGAYLLLGSWAPGLSLERDTSEEAGAVEVVRQNRGDVVLRGLDLRDLGVRRAPRVRAGKDVTVVLEGSSGPLISRGDIDGVHFVHVAFSTALEDSSLALLPAFPLLIKDTLLTLAPDRRRLFPPAVAAGRALTARRPVPRGLEAHPVFTPDGADPVRLDVVGPGPTVRFPVRPGRGTLELAGRAEPLGVFAGGRAELDLDSRLSGERVSGDLPVPEVRDEPVDWSPLFLIVALALFLLEWATYTRGLTR